MKKIVLGLAIISIVVVSCTTHQKVVKVETQIQEAKKEERSLKRKVAIARFTNETQYAKGIFYDKNNNNPVEKKKLSFKEKEEFKQLEKDLEKWEEEKNTLTNVLSDSNSSNDDIMKAGTKLSEIVQKIEMATERWMELAEFA